MSLFGSSYALFYLKRQSLDVYSPGKSAVTLSFPPESVMAGEILDTEKFRARLVDFLTVNKFTKRKSVVVLADELIFQKDIAEKDKLISEIPFAPEKIVSKSYSDKKVVVCVNGEIFKLLAEEMKVDFVVPQTLLGIPSVTMQNFRQILRNKRLLRKYNLLNIESGRKVPSRVLPVILIIVFLLAVSGGAYYYFKVYKINKKLSTTSEGTIVQESLTPEAAAPASVTASPTNLPSKAKKDITLKVVNGTGTAGDAKKVKDALETLGFVNIDTGNLDVQDATESSITYSPSGAFYLTEITTALEKIFTIKPTPTATDSSSLDFLIVTGK